MTIMLIYLVNVYQHIRIFIDKWANKACIWYYDAFISDDNAHV